MKRKRPDRTRATHVRELLTSNPAAVHCLELQRREEGLLAQVRELLAPEARAHCLQANATQGNLTLVVDSAAWATRLRYQCPDLARSLAGAGITGVKVRARPRERIPTRQTTEHLSQLTPAAADHLLGAAEHTADAGIAEVFRRLASRRRGLRPGQGTD